MSKSKWIKVVMSCTIYKKCDKCLANYVGSHTCPKWMLAIINGKKSNESDYRTKPKAD